ncbi:MAG: GAF domain-containing protein [Candidatus Goldiibacteriota bacterium]
MNILLKIIIFLLPAVMPALILKTDVSMHPVFLFALNISLAGGLMFLGGFFILLIPALVMVSYAVSVFSVLGAQAPLWPAAVQAGISIMVFAAVKKAGDIHSYGIGAINGELKDIEAKSDTAAAEKQKILAGIELNTGKLEKFRQLKEIRDNLKNFSVFSEKIRYMMRNIIYMFHKEKTACLYLLKEGKSMKIVADREDDILIGEKDSDALILKKFDEWVVENRQSLIIADMNKEVRFSVEKTERVRSLITVPILVGAEAAGILKITSDEPEVFSKEDLRFLDIIAGIISGILEAEGYA